MAATVRPVFELDDDSVEAQLQAEASMRRASYKLWLASLPVIRFGRQLAAQQQGPSTDPEKLGAAEAERLPFWVHDDRGAR